MLPGLIPVPPRAPATALTFTASNTSTGSTITAPGSIVAGDLLVIWDQALNAAGLPTSVVPTGFTSIVDFNDGATERCIASFKIAVGNESGASITVMNGTSSNASTILQFRGDNPITAATVASLASQATTGNPTAQVVTSSGGAVPLVVLMFFFQSLIGTGASFSPAQDAFVPGTANGSANIGYKIYNSAPANVTVDIADGGTNFLASCYIQVK